MYMYIHMQTQAPVLNAQNEMLMNACKFIIRIMWQLVDFECHLNLHGDGEIILAGGLAGFESALQAELAVNTLNTVGRVDVLDQCQLVAGGTTLSGGDGAVGEEVLPDLRSDVGQSTLSKLTVIDENIP
jgi:hypothetical protein